MFCERSIEMFNRKTALSLVVGIFSGIVLLGLVGWVSAPTMMLTETLSPYGVDETVEKIKANALAEGWVVAGVKPLHKSVKKHGGGDLPPVMLINLCQAHHAYKILREEGSRIVSVMMPCTISVYQKDDGKTYIGTMNAGLMGKMFGGTVAQVMGEDVAAQQQNFIAFATQSQQ
jgi:uncharacterized protein (DUF302 family)